MSGVSSADGPADVREVVSRLRAEYPRARTELDFRDAFELLVATVLSAQTTDARVNSVTPELFGRWPGPEGLAGADPAEVEKVLKPLGMGPTRAARVIALARALLADHGGEVPDDQDALEALPGVGRKTAFVVRGVRFGRSLLAVDTHVTRVAGRLGWTRSRQARTVEHDVVALVQSADAAAAEGDAEEGDAEEGDAREGDAAAETSDPTTDLTALSLRLILHGRRVCTARSPDCTECALVDLCPRIGVAA